MQPDASGRAAPGEPGSVATPPRLAWLRAARRQGALLSGALMVLLVVVAFVTFAVYQRADGLGAERQRSLLLLRVLEDHVARSLDATALALETLAAAQSRMSDADPAARQSWLPPTVAGLPLLRSLAVIDERGRVLASTEPQESGLMLDLRRLGPWPALGSAQLGGMVAGRDLRDLQRQALRVDSAGAEASPGWGLVPLVRTSVAADGQRRLLLAVLSPDVILRHQERVLEEVGRAVTLAAPDGRVLGASTRSVQRSRPTLADLPVFQRPLPAGESLQYTGIGPRGDDQLVTYGRLQDWPLVVIVEASQADARLAWQRAMRWPLLAALALVLAISAMSVVLHRSQRAGAEARRLRDEAQAEVALRERELSVIVKSVQELLFRTDDQGRLIFVNARWHAASGCPEHLALGRPLPELVDPHSADAADALFEHDGPAGVRVAQLMMGPVGELRRFDVAVVPLRSAGAVVGFAGSAIDVTEQCWAQSQLQSQLRFTELLLEVLPLPLSILNPAGHYLSVNKAWEEFTGRSRAAVLGTRAGSDLPPAEAAAHRARDKQLLAAGGCIRYEASTLRHDGQRRDLAITKAAVPGEDGRTAGILVAFMDVSDIRQAERATRDARDAAEEASRAKTEFVANISHELRTPLQTIIGFSELGQMRSGAQAKLGSMFGDIHAAGHRMLALVNDLLDVSKIESTVGTFHLERTDVRSLVRDVGGELQPLLAARRLDLQVDLGELPLVAKVDPTRFQQVVRNVLANAIRYSPVGEVLRVTGELTPDHRIHLVVRDRGPGIPPTELDKIFEAFVQSSKTKDGAGGTGLGLAICRKILQAHGGEICASNDAGGGSSFHILLPARSFADTMTHFEPVL